MGTLLERLPLPGFLKPEPTGKFYGAVGVFRTPEDLVRAIRTIRTAGYDRVEAYTPFPIHGIDEAMGEGRSPLGRIVICCALLGLSSAVALQWWTGAVDYPLVIAGKPLFAFEPSVPIMFELSILFSAFGSVLGMFHLNKLPTYYHPIFNYKAYQGATDSHFVLAIEATNPKFVPEEAKTLLESLGAESVDVVES
jgi:hypothetical protein